MDNFCIYCVFLVERETISAIPCGVDSSTHPWSTVFNKLCATGINILRICCDDSGVRNHIIAFAWWAFPMVLAREVWFEVVANATRPPKIVIIKGDHFIAWGRNGSMEGAIIIQFTIPPPVIAPAARNIIGTVVFVSSSDVVCGGRLMLCEVKAVMVNRTE